MGYFFILLMTVSAAWAGPGGFWWGFYFGALGAEIFFQYHSLQRQVRGKERDLF